jgi:hypothetical protein
MITKLLLVRKPNAKSSLLSDLGVSSFVVGNPISICPIAWGEEARVSHFGYQLDKLKIDDLDKLEQQLDLADGVTLHPFDETIENSLSQIGLRINDAA